MAVTQRRCDGIMNILENIVSSFIEPNIFDEPRRSGLYIRIIHTSLQATTRN